VLLKDLWFARRNARQLLLRRSRSFAVFIAVGVAFAVLCGGLVSQAARAGQERVQESSLMRTVEVSSFGVSKPIPLTHQRMVEIQALPQVVSVQPWIQAGCLITKSVAEAPGVLWATPRMLVGQPPLVATIRDQPLPMAANEVILPAHVHGNDLRPLLNTTVTVEYTRRVSVDTGEPVYLELRVIGLYDESVGGRDGPAAAYLDLDTVLRMAATREGVTSDAFGRNIGYPKAIVEVARAADVSMVQRRLTDLGYNASSLQSQMSSLPPVMELISMLGKLMTGILIFISLVAGLSIGANLVHARIYEIGLLKALGFSNGRVARLFAIELLLFGLTAAGSGMLIGVAGVLAFQLLLRGRTLLDVQMADVVVFPSPWGIALLTVAPALALLVGAILPLRSAAKLPSDIALRDST
jgi:putative ABC transport system permease protein